MNEKPGAVKSLLEHKSRTWNLKEAVADVKIKCMIYYLYNKEDLN